MKTIASELWKKTLGILESEMDSETFTTWFDEKIKFIRFNKASGELLLEVETVFRKAQLEYSFQAILDTAASESFGSDVKAVFLLPGDEKPEDIRIMGEDPLPDENIFNPRYTFDNFIVGDNSRFAAGAAQEVAKAPGKTYSPLFIYGGSGLGKTHLMNAIGIYILENFPKLKVLFVSSETFTEDFVNASLNKKMNVFKEKYRSVDVLLIDDIQFISEKEKTIEEVFNTFNTLYASGKQMVFTSDRPPKDFLGVDERLVGRLASGLLVDLKPPSYEIKVAILKNKALLEGIIKDGNSVDDGLSEVISFIAESIKSNVRELESAFNRVVAYAKFVGVPFTKALARQVLSDVVKMRGDGPSGKDIRKVVSAHFGISISSIDSDARTRSLSMPRQIAMYLCREMTPLSFPKIAELFKKDYSTVHHAYDKIKKEIETNDHLKNTVNELIERIQTEY